MIINGENAMKTGTIRFGDQSVEVRLPQLTDVFAMTPAQPLTNPAAAVEDALLNSIASPGLDELIKAKLRANSEARAVVVISDNTRPVPYRGETGILWPIINKLLGHGFSNDRILILVATGTHRPLTESELRSMLDPKIFEIGIPIVNHRSDQPANLVYLGVTARGSKIYINRHYVQADLKILTGLVESHFMAGVSGGRKSVCPGLIGEEGTYVFHSAPMLASENACDLVLDDNPCHEESLEFARKAGVDYIVNVTLDHHFNLTGVFAGNLEKAHRKAFERLREYVALPFDEEYDLVITHAGFVGINHYQAAKAGVAASRLLKAGGRLIMAANNTDSEPIGSLRYQTVLQLFKLIGVEAFNRLILSPDWSFIPEQWQVQMWGKLYNKIAPEDFIYYSPGLSPRDYAILPSVDGNSFLDEEMRYGGSLLNIPMVIERAWREAVAELEREGIARPRVAFLAEGPYGIPVKRHAPPMGFY
jgi:nickel-dependent lactate racemase